MAVIYQCNKRPCLWTGFYDKRATNAQQTRTKRPIFQKKRSASTPVHLFTVFPLSKAVYFAHKHVASSIYLFINAYIGCVLWNLCHMFRFVSLPSFFIVNTLFQMLLTVTGLHQ